MSGWLALAVYLVGFLITGRIFYRICARGTYPNWADDAMGSVLAGFLWPLVAVAAVAFGVVWLLTLWWRRPAMVENWWVRRTARRDEAARLGDHVHTSACLTDGCKLIGPLA